MADSGSVKAEVVVEVLRAHDVDVSTDSTSENEQTVMIDGDVVEVQEFPSTVNRRMVNRLAHKFNVPIHHFYHPELSG